jgi:hypothetical protein
MRKGGTTMAINFLGRHWGKLAVLGMVGGTAAALFGGSAVMTAFSASSPETATVSGATVAETYSGSITCTNLLPGGTYCNSGQLSLNNTGTVDETFTITLGNIIVNDGGVNGDVKTNLDQAYVCMGFGAGPVLGTGNCYNAAGMVPLTTYYTDGTGSVIGTGIYGAGSVGSGGSSHGEFQLYIESGTQVATGDDLNAWNGASITLPYTVTATAGS